VSLAVRIWVGAALATQLFFSADDMRQAAGAPVTVLFGDVNCSAEVDSVDSLTILRFSAGLPQPQGTDCRIGYTVLVDDQSRIWGDNNCDGSVDSRDAISELRWLARLTYVRNPACPEIGTPVQVDFGQ
jgi:hypothetical protein